MADLGTIEQFGWGNDSIVIRRYIAGLQGGRVLDVSDFTLEFIRAGHVILHDTTNGGYKPMPVNDDKDGYADLPDGCEYAGVAAATKSVKDPFVSIMYAGEVNDEAVPFSIDDIKDALKEALPTLSFQHD